jgi:hypothetical protein
MSNIRQLYISLLVLTASLRRSMLRPRNWILAISLIAASLSLGCPNQDPLQAFNNPSTSPGNPANPDDPAPAPVPEPVTALLLGTALLVGGGILRRRRNKKQP